ncbi:Endoribonuclease YbeY [Buchnera aphidicola (Cinara curtihirsuta)]|nr:Endoribonuclease YbeY [Buchnera aphidicola (Cinara curtihirsuta)]
MKIYIQKACKKNIFFPKKKNFLLWLKEVFKKKNIEITIRLVNIEEIKFLNKKYRNKSIPTNVLSFKSTIHLSIKKNFLFYIGDIILCAPYINKEARNLKKNVLEHWAHMSIHSALHLINYKHDTQKDRKKMEKVEKKIMMKLGFRNPYYIHD